MLHINSAAMCQAGQDTSAQKLHRELKNVKGSFDHFVNIGIMLIALACTSLSSAFNLFFLVFVICLSN